MTEEYLAQSHLTGKSPIFSAMAPMKMTFIPLEYGTLKINIDATFANGKLGRGILIRNSLGIPILAKVVLNKEIFQ